MHTVSMSHISHPLSASTQFYPMSLYAPGKIQQLLHRAKEIGAALPQSEYNFYKNPNLAGNCGKWVFVHRILIT